ncbi:hypothetical protein C0J52_16713 [Blattella germanica]|nr:hypothetical protein C0J52_16713 [Blattella germanica]
MRNLSSTEVPEQVETQNRPRPPAVAPTPPTSPPVPLPPPGAGGTSPIIVRAEEALIVLLVLVLWVAAIALFFNRWGKIRMLEPYQPKFQQQHRSSCPMVDINGPIGLQMDDQNGSRQNDPLRHAECISFDETKPFLEKMRGKPLNGPEDTQGGTYSTGLLNYSCMRTCVHRTFSKFNVNCIGEPGHTLLRPRQNSVFVGSSTTMVTLPMNPPRKTKSAMDIQTLVLAECGPGYSGSLLPLAPASASASRRPSCSRLEAVRVTNV